MAPDPLVDLTQKVSDNLSRWFIQYWEFAERKTARNPQLPAPMLGLQRYWPDWWALELTTSERQELQSLAEVMSRDEAAQQGFVSWINGWIDNRLDLRGAGRVVLAQLAQTSLFNTGQGLARFRLGGNLLIVRQSSGDRRFAEVLPLITVAIRKKREEDLAYYPLNLVIEEKGALRWVWRAILKALQGRVFWFFLGVWLFIGRKNPHDRFRQLAKLCLLLTMLGWGAIAGLLFLLPASDLFTYLPDDRWLIPVLRALVLIPFLSLGSIVIANAREARRMKVQGRALAERLKQSQLYLLAGNRVTKAWLTVKGASFGPGLALSNLGALYEAAPPVERKSWFWQQFFEALPAWLRCASGSAEIVGSGWYSRVEHLPIKIKPSPDHPEITEIVVPVQRETLIPWLLSAQPPLTPAAGEGSAATPGAPRLLRLLWSRKGEDRPLTAGKLRLRRACHLAQTILTVGKLVTLRSLMGSVIVLFMSLFIFSLALPDVRQIGRVPPQFMNYYVSLPDAQCRPDERFLLLYFRTDSPEDFEVYDNYQNRTGKLERVRNKPGYGVASIAMNSPTLPPLFELRLHRKLLGVVLPDKNVGATVLK